MYAHIGNFRTYIFEDILRRTLEYNGYKVKHVMNITDVGHLTSDADTGEDKMEVGARREKKTVWEIAEHYADSTFSLVDCTTFALMERMGITHAFGFDDHFLYYQYGRDTKEHFTRLP